MREGPTSAGMIVSTAQRGGSFREAFAMAKAYTEARKEHGDSALLDELVSSKPEMDHTKAHSAEELKEHGLQRIREAVALLEQKATPRGGRGLPALCHLAGEARRRRQDRGRRQADQRGGDRGDRRDHRGPRVALTAVARSASPGPASPRLLRPCADPARCRSERGSPERFRLAAACRCSPSLCPDPARRGRFLIQQSENFAPVAFSWVGAGRRPPCPFGLPEGRPKIWRRIPWKAVWAIALWLVKRDEERVQENLTQREQRELLHLVTKSRGQPSNLSERDRTRIKNIVGTAVRHGAPASTGKETRNRRRSH